MPGLAFPLPTPVIILAVCLLSGQALPAATNAPIIACDAPLHDFGSVTGEDIVNHTFLLENRGQADLHVLKVQVSCGCTTTKLARDTIPPGETAALSVGFNPKGRRGPQSKDIYVHSNDPAHPLFRLMMQGEVHNDVDVIPPQILMGASGSASNYEGMATINCNLAAPFKVTGLDTNRLPFCTAVLTSLPGGRQHQLRLVAMPGLTEKNGLQRGEVGVLTDHPAYARITVPVSLYVREDVSVVPREISLPATGRGTNTLTRFVFVRSATDHSLRVEDVVVPDPRMQITRQAMGKGRYRILIEGIRVTPELDGKVIQIRVLGVGGCEKTLSVPLRVKRERTPL